MAIELNNKSDNKFVDISTEVGRTYFFPGGDEVYISAPQWLSVSAGGHRILDGEGFSHYIPKGWIRITWKVKAGNPHFVK